MPRVSFIDLAEEHSRLRKHCVEHAERYLAKIKELCKRIDPDCRVIVFGSYVEGRMRPDSDIDVLLVTDGAADPRYRMRIYAEVARELGVITPFQIHVVTREEYEEWYRRFIRSFREI